MKRAWLCFAAALALAGCGGGDNSNSPPPRPTASLLAAFDAHAWLGDFPLPNATDYWAGAEARNGNTFPIKAKAAQPDLMVVRITASGQTQILNKDAFEDAPGAELRRRVDQHALAFLPEGGTDSAAAVAVAAHPDAPWITFLTLCRLCTAVHVRNLWLVTRDTRDGACRLLPLGISPESADSPWLGRAADLPPETARLRWGGDRPDMLFEGDKRLAAENDQWGPAFIAGAQSIRPRPRRLQVQLGRLADMRRFENVLDQLADGAFAQIEPLWPVAEAGNLLDIPEYWKAGNTGEVQIDATGAPELLEVRLEAEAGLSTFDGRAWATTSPGGLRSTIQDLAARTGAAGTLTSGLHVVCHARPDAHWRSLIDLCRTCVQQRVARLSLATLDQRRGVRLLALYVDITQADQPWYAVSPDEVPNLAGLFWAGQDRPTFVLSDGTEVVPKTAKGWGRELREAVAFKNPRPRRLQIDLPPKTPLRRLETILREAAGAGFTAIEPFWPVLIERDPDAKPPVVRTLATYPDALGLAARVEPPTLAEYWRAVEQMPSLAAAAIPVQARPVLYLCLDSENRWSSRVDTESAWQDHADAGALTERLVSQAGEVDADNGSALQIIFAPDRRAHWSRVLDLYAAMARTGVRTLLVLTMDQLGPRTRLFDLSPRPQQDGAVLEVSRDGIPEDGRYKAVLRAGGEPMQAEGALFLTILARQVASRRETPASLALRLPADEPVETFFFALNALARLGMGSVRVIP